MATSACVFLWSVGGGAFPRLPIAGSAPGDGAAWWASEGGFDGEAWGVVQESRAVGVGLGRTDIGCVFLTVGPLEIGGGWVGADAAT